MVKHYYILVLDEAESKFYLDQLQKEYAYKQMMIRIYDKDVLQPRLTALCGDPGGSLD